MPPVISTSWHNTADLFLVFELYISRITYSFGSDSFYSILGWRMIHLCYYISSFCVDFHCDNIGQCTSLSVEDQHLGTFCCYCYCSVVSNSLWPPWTVAHQSSLSFTISWSLLKLMSIELMMPSNHLILCLPLLLLPSIFPSIRVFSSELALHIMWPNCWSFSISPSNEYSGLISYRSDCFGLLAVQEALKSILQHHSSKASVLWHSAFFMVQLSNSCWLLEKL